MIPKFRKLASKLICNDVVSVQPMRKPKSSVFFLDYIWLESYWAEEIYDGVWQTCSYEDIARPGYEPHFVVSCNKGFIVYDGEGKPIVCTDREMFKYAKEFNIEKAQFTNESDKKTFYE